VFKIGGKWLRHEIIAYIPLLNIPDSPSNARKICGFIPISNIYSMKWLSTCV